MINMQSILTYSITIFGIICFFSIFFESNNPQIIALAVIIIAISFSRIVSQILRKISFIDDPKIDLIIGLIVAFTILSEISNESASTLWFLSMSAWLHSWLAVEKTMKNSDKNFPFDIL